jgi:hypothetical protein
VSIVDDTDAIGARLKEIERRIALERAAEHMRQNPFSPSTGHANHHEAEPQQRWIVSDDGGVIYSAPVSGVPWGGF